MARTRSKLVTSCSPDEICFTNTSGPLHAIPAPSTRLGHMEVATETREIEEVISQKKSDVNRNHIAAACPMDNSKDDESSLEAAETQPDSPSSSSSSSSEEVQSPRHLQRVTSCRGENGKRTMNMDERAPAEKMMRVESSAVEEPEEETEGETVVEDDGEEQSDEISEEADELVEYRANYAWTWSDVEAHPLLVEKGITNTRNKCYAISIFQLLAHIPPILKIVEDHRHDDNLYQKDCIACEWTKHILHINVRPHNTSFYWFEKCFESVWPIVRNAEQEDATEALFHILLKLDIIAAMKNPPNSKCVASEDIFGFRITIGRRCMTCDSNVESTQVHKSLNLAFPQDSTPRQPPTPPAKGAKNMKNKREYGLYEMLDHYFKNNKIDPVRCFKCEQDRTVDENQLISRFPNVLLIHILRFETNGCQIVKIDNPVAAPFELKLGKYASDPTMETDYELSGMLIHSGSNCEKGHYHTIVQKYRQPDEWVNLDDHMVQMGEVKLKYEKQGYMLVYRRKSHTNIDKVYIRDYSRMFDYSASFLTADHNPPPKKAREHTSPRRGSRQEH